MAIGALLAPPAPARPPQRRQAPKADVEVVQTTADRRQALTELPRLAFRARHASAPVLHVDPSVHYQPITGFGAALTDSSAWLLARRLSPSDSHVALERLFAGGPTGLGLTFLRLPIAASDFTVGGRPYSYDDLPAGQTDPDLARFSIAHDLAYIVPTLRRIRAMQPRLRIMANPWTMPPWMKANGAYDNAGGRGRLLPGTLPAMARYLVAFLAAYQQQGIGIADLGIENEPNAGSRFPAMNLPSDQEAELLINELPPLLRDAGLHPAIYAYDSGADPTYPNALLSGPAARSLSAIAWHCYGGPRYMAELARAHPGLTQLVSECSPGIIPYNAVQAAIVGTRNGASRVALWNLALDPAGGPVEPPNSGCHSCTGLVTVDPGRRTFTPTLNYFRFGQVSRFVAPGAVRISSDRWVRDFYRSAHDYGVTPGLDDVAFRNPDGTIVLVAYNSGPAAARFALRRGDRYLNYRLEPGATVTFRWR